VYIPLTEISLHNSQAGLEVADIVFEETPTMAANKDQVEYTELDIPAGRRSLRRDQDAEAWWRRFLIFAVLLPPIMMNLLIIVALNNGWRIHGIAQRWIDDNRGTTQIVVQLLSGVLGVCDVVVVRKLINFSSRLAMCQTPIMLYKLNLIAALSIDRLDLSLRHKHLIILCALLDADHSSCRYVGRGLSSY